MTDIIIQGIGGRMGHVLCEMIAQREDCRVVAITLRHTAYSRNIFANGAINAAVYLAKKEPGLYNMSNMIAEM